MKKALPLALGIMTLAIVLLLLNLREADHYEFGSLGGPAPGSDVPADDFAIQRIFPEMKFIHVCAGCGECVHPFVIVKNRRLMVVEDEDGWYKLFWARNERYSYSDPIHMLADWGKNRSARLPEGLWVINLRAASATHGSAPAHDCGQIPQEISLAYELVVSETPIDETFHSGDGPLRIPETFSWLVTNPGRPISLGWRASGDPRISAAPCSCAKP